MTFQEFLIAVVQHPIAIRHNESWEADEERKRITFSPGTIVELRGNAVHVSHINCTGDEFTPMTTVSLNNALDYAMEMSETATELDRKDRKWREANQS